MRDPARGIPKPATWLVIAGLLSGCGEEAPPYDALPLRDALRATPEVVAGLPFETRHAIAQRLEEARPKDGDATTIVAPQISTIDAVSMAVDEARDDLGQDALVLGEVVSNDDMFVVSQRGIDDDALAVMASGPFLLRGRPSTTTAPLEDAALRGRAGQLLRELSRRTNAEEIVRTTNLPLGAWAKDETLYVNASWLVAMSALEETPAPMATPGVGFAPAIDEPGKSPLTVDFNPYNLPESLLQCWDQVEATCTCGTVCAHEPTDPSFANAVEECAWVNQDPANGAALCILALLDIDAIRACVESGRSCSALPVTSRADAVRFLTNDACVKFLDDCLRDGYISVPPPSTSSGGGGGGSSSSGGSTCGSDCSGFNDRCSQCNDDCNECNENWDECNQNCKDCNDNYEDTKNCSVKPVAKNTNSGPLGTTFWLMAPIVYVLYRGRRRA